MSYDNHINDEMLARFLSGASSAYEENAVLDAVAEDDTLEAEILNIADAVAAQRSFEQEQRIHAAVIRRRMWSIAAMVVVVLVSGVVWIANKEDGNKDVIVAENLMKDDNDDVRLIEVNDNSVVLSPTRRSTGTFDELSTGVESSSKLLDEKKAFKELERYNDHEIRDHNDYQLQSFSLSIKDNSLILNSNRVKKPFVVRYPNSQKVEVSKSNDFTFLFSNTGNQCMLVVTNDEGLEIVRVDVTDKESYNLSHVRYGNTSSLKWTLTQVAPDGLETSHSGTILLVD